MSKYKDQVLARIEKSRQLIRNIKYLHNTNAPFDDIERAYEKAFENLDEEEGLVNLEEDSFRTNQII